MLQQTADGTGRLRVVLACSGLGTVRRGYESFMQDCFEALKGDPSLDLRLFKGGGERTPDQVPLAHFPRHSLGARAIGEMVGRGPYVIEQVTFTASLVPHLARFKPDLVFFCDPAIGKMLRQWRRLSGDNFGLLFSNGGPLPPPFGWCDHVQQVTPVGVEEALAAGHPAARQTLLPCGLDLGRAEPPLDGEARMALRKRLCLPVDRPILLSVGALNRGHKRMDYLINEIASLPNPRPYVVMLGHAEDDTPALRALATLRLGSDGMRMDTVSHAEMADFYRAADLFALASLKEGFGIVYAEALAHGLRVIAHDYPIARYVMGDDARYADLRHHGALASVVHDVLQQPDTDNEREHRQHAVRRRFDWEELAPRYVAMFWQAAACAADAALVPC